MIPVEAPGTRPPDGLPELFLAGGITGVEDWQSAALAVIGGWDRPVVVYNPRRAGFPIHDPASAEGQIRWEHEHLHRPGLLTVFWFPAGTPVQPIALFELGAALGEGRPLVVGAAHGYPRHTDVVIQCHLAAPALRVHTDLHATLADAWARLPG